MIAMIELWLRLFASIIAPIGIMYLLMLFVVIQRRRRRRRKTNNAEQAQTKATTKTKTSNQKQTKSSPRSKSNNNNNINSNNNGEAEEERTSEQPENDDEEEKSEAETEEDDQQRQQHQQQEEVKAKQDNTNHNSNNSSRSKPLLLLSSSSISSSSLSMSLSSSSLSAVGCCESATTTPTSNNPSTPVEAEGTMKICVVIVLTLSSSLVLMTDSLYVLEFGHLYGCLLFVTSLLLTIMTTTTTTTITTIATTTIPSIRRSSSSFQYFKIACCLFFMFLAFHLVWDEQHQCVSFGDPNDSIGQLQEGLYYDSSNEWIANIVREWPISSRTYSTSSSGTSTSSAVATPWLPTGDARTGIPFLINNADAMDTTTTSTEPDITSTTPPPPTTTTDTTMDTTTTTATGSLWSRWRQQDYRKNKKPSKQYHRIFIKTHDEKEVLALDVSFPNVGGFDISKPTYIVLHGLNGGSQEEFVKDFIHRCNSIQYNSTVIVMIARGLMDLPVRGWDMFHGARIDDIHTTATTIRNAMTTMIQQQQQLQHNQRSQNDTSTTAYSRSDNRKITTPRRRDGFLAGVGFSMGGIVLSNYVTRYGQGGRRNHNNNNNNPHHRDHDIVQNSPSSSSFPLDTGISISGGLDMRYEHNFTRAQRLWQPFLTDTLRSQFLLQKFGHRYYHRLTKQQFLSVMRATHVSEIDEYAITPYNGFDNVTHYYMEMSALGDIPIQDQQDLYNNNNNHHHHHHNNNGEKDVSSSSSCSACLGTHCNSTTTTTTTTTTIDTVTKGKHISQLSIPFCVVHALDDPLITWKTVASNHEQSLLYPPTLTQTGSGLLMILLTKRGGHVGWPVGWFPSQHNWYWMNHAALEFVEAVHRTTTTTSSSSTTTSSSTSSGSNHSTTTITNSHNRSNTNIS